MINQINLCTPVPGAIPTEADHWHALLQELDATPGMLDAPEVKERLCSNGEQGIAAGVFGVLTSVVDDRCFWALIQPTC